MANGKKFSTGNHPVEMTLPILQILSAGFEIDVITPTGAPSRSKCGRCLIKTRMSQGCSIRLRRRLKPQKPCPFCRQAMIQGASFIALFIRGGHGAMLRLADNPNVKKMFHWAHNRTLFTLTIYHGPAALLAAGAGNSFIYNKIPNCGFIRRN